MELLGHIILWILFFLLGGSVAFTLIKRDVEKLGYTNVIKGMYLQKYAGPDKITENRGIQFLIKVKEQYPEVSIDKMNKIWINEGFVVK